MLVRGPKMWFVFVVSLWRDSEVAEAAAFWRMWLGQNRNSARWKRPRRTPEHERWCCIVLCVVILESVRRSFTGIDVERRAFTCREVPFTSPDAASLLSHIGHKRSVTAVKSFGTDVVERGQAAADGEHSALSCDIVYCARASTLANFTGDVFLYTVAYYVHQISKPASPWSSPLPWCCIPT